MADGTVGVKQATAPDRLIDNEVVTNELGQTVYRQKTAAIDSGERELTHIVATVTAAGDTTVHTPASGKKVRLWWLYVMPDPSSSSVPLVKVSLGAAEKFRTYGMQKRQRVTGAANAALVVNLSSSGSVAVTALLEEVD